MRTVGCCKAYPERGKGWEALTQAGENHLGVALIQLGLPR